MTTLNNTVNSATKLTQSERKILLDAVLAYLEITKLTPVDFLHELKELAEQITFHRMEEFVDSYRKNA